MALPPTGRDHQKTPAFSYVRFSYRTFSAASGRKAGRTEEPGKKAGRTIGGHPMRRFRYLLWVGCLAGLAALVPAASAANPVPADQYDALRKAIKPAPGEDKW